MMAIRELTDDERDAVAEAQALPDLRLLVAQLHRYREDFAIVDAVLKAQREAFEREHADILRQHDRLAGALEAATQCVREAALEAFGRTDNKHPAPGLTVREHQRLQYDEHEALQWCGHDLPAAIVRHAPALDRKVFEATALALGLERLVEEAETDWIRQETTYDVAIDRDLGKALIEEAP